MTHIVIDDEQARLIAGTRERVEIRDQNGNCLGYFLPEFSDADIALAKARRDSDEPRKSTAEVLEHLRSLSNS